MAIKPVVRYMLLCDDWELDTTNEHRINIFGLISTIRSVEEPPSPSSAELRSPFSGRRALPLLEGAEERVGVFVAQEVRGFVQLERRVSEIVARQLTSRK